MVLLWNADIIDSQNISDLLQFMAEWREDEFLLTPNMGPDTSFSKNADPWKRSFR
jgi:hypothetical protein